MTKRLIRSGVLKAQNNLEKGRINIKKGGKKNNDSSEEEDY